MEEDKDSIINFETMGGWPIFKLTLRNILECIGFEENEGKFSIDTNNKILDKCPIVLEDDGMGYGVNQEYICSAHHNEDGTVVMFREKELDNIGVWLENDLYRGQDIEVHGVPYFLHNISKDSDGNYVMEAIKLGGKRTSITLTIEDAKKYADEFDRKSEVYTV